MNIYIVISVVLVAVMVIVIFYIHDLIAVPMFLMVGVVLILFIFFCSLNSIGSRIKYEKPLAVGVSQNAIFVQYINSYGDKSVATLEEHKWFKVKEEDIWIREEFITNRWDMECAPSVSIIATNFN